MRFQIIYIRDIKADCIPFMPMHVNHLGMAIRDFGDQCRDEKTTIGKHPGDYELYHKGEWDDNTGEYHLLDRPKQLAVGSNYSKAAEAAAQTNGHAITKELETLREAARNAGAAAAYWQSRAEAAESTKE